MNFHLQITNIRFLITKSQKQNIIYIDTYSIEVFVLRITNV